MTLILSVSTSSYGLQVGDRLVSKSGVPFDPLANKSLVIGCTDGLLALSYTGRAYVRREPTDEWLAVQVTQSPEVRKGAVLFGDFAVGNTGSMLHRVADRLSQSPFIQQAGALTAVGWQWDAKRNRSLLRNVLWQTRYEDGRLVWEQTMPRERDERQTSVRLQWIGNCPLTHERMREVLYTAQTSGRDWKTVEEQLVAAIRESSELRPGMIGQHCMSTVVRKWADPSVKIRFHPAEPHYTTAHSEAVQVAYTPWIIASDNVNAPALSVGGMRSGGTELSYEVSDLGHAEGQTLVGMFARQNRPRP